MTAPDPSASDPSAAERLVPGLGRRAPGRRERRRLEVHARIVAAAATLFDERGYDDTRVAEIAARADVAEKTFFNHFPTKQHVVRELAYAALDTLLERVEDTRKHAGGVRDRLHHFFVQVAEGALEGGPMRRELLTETIHALHDARDESQQVRRIHEAFTALVDDAIARGEVAAGHDTETLTNVILGAFYSLMFNWAHVDGYPIRAQAEATAHVLACALESQPHPPEGDRA